jgi:cytochrome c
MTKVYLVLGLCALIALSGNVFVKPDMAQNIAQAPSVGTPAMVSVTMPEITGNAALGQTIFENICSTCHGRNGSGNAEAGPPLIHKIYEPSHHGDESFQRAVALGVKSHHWKFGNMPAIKGLTRGDVAMVTEYIRQIQRANGIN